MKIKEIEFARLRNLGNYENETVKGIAIVEEGENPEEALAELKDWVKTGLGLTVDKSRRIG